MPDGNYRQSVITRQELDNAEMGNPRRAMVVGRPPGLDALVQRHNRQNVANTENSEHVENRENIENRGNIENIGNIQNRENIRNHQSSQENLRPTTANSTNSENTEMEQFRQFSQQFL